MTKYLRLSFLAYILLTLTACATVSVAAPADTAEPTLPPPTVVPSPTAKPLATDPTDFVCPVTTTQMGEPPEDPNSDPFGYGPWFVNADQTIWAGWDPEQWTAGRDGNKTVWIRPQGTHLKITGHRLDGEADPIKADIPCCYPTGFQIVGLYFPTAGCWQVNADSGSSHLQFTVEVS